MPDLPNVEAENIDSEDTQIERQEDPAAAKQVIDNRHLVRQLVIQQLYQKHFQGMSNLNVDVHVADPSEDLEFENISSKLLKKLNKSEEEVKELTEAIWKTREKLDTVIAKFAPAWPINQINPVDLQILRLALYEGFASDIVPKKVAIDEGIELSRDFGGEANIKFISGVLGHIYSESNSGNLSL